MFNEFKRLKQTSSETFAALSKSNQIFIVAVIAILFMYIFFWAADKLFLYVLARSYVSEIADVFNLNTHLAAAASFAVFIMFVYLLTLTFSFSRSRRIIGVLGLAAMVLTHSLLLWQGTQNQFFDRSGKAIKCYILSRDGVVRYMERAGIDPITGKQCRDVTPELIERLQEYARGRRPELVLEDEPVFFDQRTGDPIIWYWRAKAGDIELFNLMGFHPESGEELLPVTPAVVAEWKQQWIWKERHRHPPNRVDPLTYDFFDPKTGEVRGWYWRSPDGEYEFYDNPGFQPSTGDALIPATKDVVEDWKRGTEKRCYVITRDTVFYRSKPGIDPATGRQCRPLTAGVLEKLREYEKGKRPNHVNSAEPVFYDVRSGDAAIWYSRGPEAKISLFDLMGFDPETGEELLPITPKIVAEWKGQRDDELRKQRPPKQIDPNNAVFFDPASGKPQVWFWRGPDGEYEFYDNAGYHPRTGEALTVVNKGVVDAWKQHVKDTLRREKEERLKRDKEESDRNEREAQKMRAGSMCDQAAANPADPRKPSEVPGVRYEELKEAAAKALEICRVAMVSFPSELRYTYQYARALGFSEPEEAIVIYRKLTRQGYPAAFDNLGSLLLQRKDRKSFNEAINVFNEGVRIGDPDSMVTLSALIVRGYYGVENPYDYSLKLLRDAAALGHPGAKLAIEKMETERQQQQQNRASQQQQQQMQEQIMLELFRNILGGAIRR